jgi:recombination protein RecA
MGVAADIIEKSGAWYSFEGERIGQGRENVKRFMQDNPDIFQNIQNRVKTALGLRVPAPEAGEAPPAVD